MQMNISVKILMIPGITEKTINDNITIEGKPTLMSLLKLIKNKYGMDLTANNNLIVLLDGTMVNLSCTDMSIESSKEFMVIPMISGG